MEDQHSDEEKFSPINYGQSKYWDQRYVQRSGQRFQWLQSYSRLKEDLQKCMPKGKQSRILNIGCGNSSIQQYLYQDGYHNIVSNDISTIVIEQMEKIAKEKGYTQLKFDVMDVRAMKYPDESFDLVFDKSTVDSLMCSDNPLMNVTKMIQQGYRVLKEGGYYFAVSYNDTRMQHFTRQIYSFELTKKELKKLNENGLQVASHLYIGKKLPMKPLSQEQRTQFYRKLKELEEKEYPS